MFKNVKQVEVDGKQVQFYLLPAFEGMTIAMKLLKTVAPQLGSVEADGTDLEVVSAMMSQLDEDVVVDIIKKLTKGMAIDGQEVKVDDYFRANYGEMLKILAVIFKENFSSFFTVNLSEIL